MSRAAIHSPDSEAYVLSALLLWPGCLAEISSVIEGRDFYAERNRLLYAAFQALDRSGKPVDLITLQQQLKADGNLEKVGIDYVVELLDIANTSVNAVHHARVVQHKAAMRRLQDGLLQMAAACQTAEDLNGHLAEIYRVIEGSGSGNAGVSGILTLADMAEMYARLVSESSKSRFKTGLEPLDNVIKGVLPGETLFICAYSGLYKSALLQNILLNGCQETGLHHLFFSLEMPPERVFERTAQIALGRYTYNIESEFHSHAHEKRAATMIELAGKGANKLLVCPHSGVNLEQIEHYTRQARAKHGKIAAIGIDYLGLMAAPGTRGEYERISKVAEDSKQLAKRLNVPVIVLTQISREAVKNGEMEMHSAKGSGAVEASADYMIGMVRDKKTGTIILKLMKNRNGESGASWEADIKKDFLQFRGLIATDTMTNGYQTRGSDRKAKATVWDDGEAMPY